MTFWQMVLANVVALIVFALGFGIIYFAIKRLPIILSNFRLERRMDRNLKRWKEEEAAEAAEKPDAYRTNMSTLGS